MLDHLAIHVGDVKRPFRPLGEIHRPEPVVTGGEELTSFIRRRGHEGRTLGGEAIGMDQVARWITREDCPGAFRRKQRLTLPDLHPAGRTERPRMAISGGDVRADREKPDAIVAAVDTIEGITLITVLHGLAERQSRITL